MKELVYYHCLILDINLSNNSNSLSACSIDNSETTYFSIMYSTLAFSMSENFISLLRLVYNYTRILAVNPYKIKKSSDEFVIEKPKHGVKGVVLRIALISAMTGFIIISEMYSGHFIRGSIYLLFIIIVIGVFTITDVISSIVFQESCFRVWANFLRIETEVYATGNKFSKIKKLFYLALSIKLAYLFFFLSQKMTKKSILGLCVLRTFVLYVYASQMMTIIYFLFTFQIAGILFEQIERQLQQRCTKFASKIHKIAGMHQELCDSVRTANTTITVKVSLLCFYSFHLSVFHVYNILCNMWQRKTCNNLTLSVIWTSYGLIIMVVFIATSESCARKASNIKKTLYHIITTSCDAREIREVNAFLLQLCHEEVKINAGGFTVLDNKLIFAIIGEMVTMLTMLVQANFNGQFED